VSATCVSGTTVLDAWRAGAAAVLQRGQITHLLTTISDPCTMNPEWLSQYSPRRMGGTHDDIRDVIDTVFPMDLSTRHTGSPRREFFDAYLRRHDRAMRWTRNRARWGTYFERLIRFPRADNVNQLDRAITKLRTWPVRNTTGLVFHLSSPATDAPRTRGGPCWHFGELLWKPGNVIDFVAVYRNHDFTNKALGNFIALGQLLGFICRESGKRPGSLVCHSIHAFRGGNASVLRRLIG